MPIFPTGYSNKTTPVDNDKIAIADSAASNAIKSVTLSNLVSNHIKAKLQSLAAWITTAMIGDGQVTDIKNKNTIRFSVWRNAAYNNPGGAFTQVPFDTEAYDVGNNCAGGVFTVPVTGLYFFNWRINISGSVARADSLITVNGVEYRRGQNIESTGSTGLGTQAALQIPLSAGDVVAIRVFTPTTVAVTNSGSQAFFEGSLVGLI